MFPICLFLNQILMRILYKICKGNLMRVMDPIDVPDFYFFIRF